jgi:peptidoglycan/LPS O-acetylase OafA/YrhL
MTALGLSWTAVFTVTFGRMDSLAVGAALATVARTPTGLNALRPFVFALVIATVVPFVAIEVMLRHIDHPNYTLALAVELSLIAACSGALLVGTMTANLDGIGARLTHSTVLRSFGKYSFALYLFHGHLNRWFEKFGFDVQGRGTQSSAGSILPKQLLYLFMAIGFSYLLAFLSWHLYEKHFLRLKTAFPSGRVPSVNNESTEPLTSCQDSPRKDRPTSPDKFVG